MHELSLCAAIADTVADHSAGREVRRIRLRIGQFRQVVPETLQYCWGLRSEGTNLEHCELSIDYVPAVARCRSCGCETTLDMPVLLCSECKGTDVELVSGEEFLIESIDLAPVPTTSQEVR